MLSDRYNGDLEKVIAAYNSGEGKVDMYRGIPPYKQTRTFVKRVLNNYHAR
jgi:soluble lytic murein transglycosylase-like protein